MIIILGILIGFVVGIVRSRRDKFEREHMGWGFAILNGFLVSMMCFIGTFIISVLIGFILPIKLEDTITETRQLVSLSDNSGIEGNFFLGTGQVKDRMVYSFYEEQEGLYRLTQIEVRDAVIRYGDLPLVETHLLQPVEGQFRALIGLNMESFRQTYVIQVPRGTIKSNFTLDAQ